MTHTRRLGALLALVLTLVLAACSTPEDLNAPTLEPQFGTAEDDISFDVTSYSTGRIYALSETNYVVENGDYDEYYESYADVYYEELHLHRYDASGNLAWSRNINTVGCSEFSYINCYGDNSLIKPLGVYTDSKSYIYALFSDTSYGEDYYVYKVNSTGDVVQYISLGEGDIESGADAAVDANGNIYIGKTMYEYDWNTDTSTYTGVVAKYSTNGTLQWQRTSTVGVLQDITISSTGSVYVVGSAGLARYSNSGGLTWKKPGNFEEVIVSGSNIYTRYRKDIRKYDGTGRQLWLRTQSGLNTIVLQDMDGDGKGNVYLSGKYQASTGNMNAMVRKLSASGSVLWTKTYGTPAYDDARGITTITGGEIYTTGETQGSLAHANIGGRDGYLRKLNSSGNPQWMK